MTYSPLLRISIVLPSCEGGGAERVMVFLANAFSAKGHDTELILGRAEGPYLQDVTDSVRIVDLDVRRMSLGLPKLVAHLRRRRPDALLSALTHANLITLIAARLSGSHARVVVAERNSVTDFAAGKVTLKRRIRNALVRGLYPKADKILVLSLAMRDEFTSYLGVPPDQVQTIYNPVPRAEILARASAQPSHPWLRNKTGHVVIAAGRLTEQKDFPTLLAAFALFSKHHRSKLIIFGEGPQKPELLALAAQLGLSDRVDIPGFTTDLAAAIRAGDLFVLSSRWEGLPNVLLEALACETPVVSTDCPTGPTEILEGGRWGRLSAVGDAEALAEAMAATVEAPLPAPAREVLSRFDPDDIVARYLAVLSNDRAAPDADIRPSRQGART